LLIIEQDNPISVTPPNHVMLEVVDTDPGLKGDTAGTGGKPATMNTGVVVQVPLFISIGEKVKVDTRTSIIHSAVVNRVLFKRIWIHKIPLTTIVIKILQI
jgi:hypothetical protein